MHGTFTALVVALACAGVFASGAVAEATPVAYDECDGSWYAVHLYDDLDHASFVGDPNAAVARARYYAANAGGDIGNDAIILAEAEAAVLGGAPSEPTLRADPVIQAWGDVVDWHTVHCVG